ncbi:MAG TPA: sulfide/dihydroorotate dehydrogenase-like FAD/NAD-binding protein [Bacteroidota bacterium]
MFIIVEKQILSSAITKFVLHAPYIARKSKAGNFVILRVNETGERIPLTIVDGNAQEGTITIIVQSVGKTTMLLSRMKQGEYLLDVAGPLGNPTPIEQFGTVVCIGGGVGTAEVFPIARALKDAGNRVITIVGARSKNLIILEDELRSFCDKVVIATEDGSAGIKGRVTDALQAYMSSNGHLGAVYAIGPIPMMKAVAEFTRPTAIPTFVSLNPLMMDGTGMCGACRVTVGGVMKFACVDGPEFDAHAVDFDELIARNRTYHDLEQLSREKFERELETEGTTPCQTR